MKNYIKKITIFIVSSIIFINCEKKINGSLNDSSDIWVIKYFVNEFKEQTDIGYITNKNPIMGTFSDIRNQDKPLKVKVMIKEKAIGIKLYEYAAEQSIRGSKKQPKEYKIKIFHNEKAIDFDFRGINDNDVIVIGNIISIDHQMKLMSYINKGGNLKFIIKEQDEKTKKEYSFEIIDNSFVDFSNAYKELTGVEFNLD